MAGGFKDRTSKGVFLYLRNNAKIFIRSFCHLKILHVALIEAALLGIIILSFILLAPVLVQKYADMSEAPALINQLDTIEPSVAIEGLQKAKDAMVSFFSITLGWFMALIMVYGIARAGQWLLVLQKKPSLSFFVRFVLYSVFYVIFIIIWTFLTLVVIKTEVYPMFFLVFSLPFLVYMNFVMQPCIAQSSALWKGIGRGINIAFKKLHLLWLPLLVIFSIFTTINSAFLAVYNATGYNITVIIYLVLMVFFLAWMKLYAFSLVEAHR